MNKMHQSTNQIARGLRDCAGVGGIDDVFVCPLVRLVFHESCGGCRGQRRPGL